MTRHQEEADKLVKKWLHNINAGRADGIDIYGALSIRIAAALEAAEKRGRVEKFREGQEDIRTRALAALHKKMKDIQSGVHPLLVKRTEREGQAVTVLDCATMIRGLPLEEK